MTESNPFDQFETQEDFSGIMADVVNSFSIVSENMEMIYGSEDTTDALDLLVAMRRVTGQRTRLLWKGTMNEFYTRHRCERMWHPNWHHGQ